MTNLCLHEDVQTFESLEGITSTESYALWELITTVFESPIKESGSRGIAISPVNKSSSSPSAKSR